MTDFPFAKRSKGQRYDKRLLPMFCFERDGKAIDHDEKKIVGAVTVHGTFKGFTGHGAPCTFEHVAVKLNDGTQVPAYRAQSDDKSFCICQDTNYKAKVTQ